MTQPITPSGPGSRTTAHYEIQVSGGLAKNWSQWFGDVAIAVEQGAGGQPLTILRCQSLDQAKLRGLLNKIWDLNLELISVRRLTGPAFAERLRKEGPEPAPGNRTEGGG